MSRFYESMVIVGLGFIAVNCNQAYADCTPCREVGSSSWNYTSCELGHRNCATLNFSSFKRCDDFRQRDLKCFDPDAALVVRQFLSSYPVERA